MRSQGVRLKFNPIVENLRGQRVVVVDDSIVRGTTTPRIVSLLRDAGAREVHLRITSPPIVHPCYLGVDMATYAELIAANLTVDQIRERVGADSLGYLSIEGWSRRPAASAATFASAASTASTRASRVRRDRCVRVHFKGAPP
jgi:amidophosphoribosyltransferase